LQQDDIRANHIFKIAPVTLQGFFDYTTDKLDRLEQMVNYAEVADKHSPSKAINAIMQKLGTEADSGIMGDARDLRRRKSFFG